MEIKYKRTYSPAKGKSYTAGEISAMLGYAIELADPRVKLKEGKMGPGEVCMLLFGITPAEYALKDSDPKAMDDLAENLRKHVPADRLVGWRILDLKGALVTRAVQVQTGESIDSGEFLRQLRAKLAQASGPIDAQLLDAAQKQRACAQKDASEEAKQAWMSARQALGAALMGLQKVWVAYDALANDRWPSVGYDGRIEIFTTIERARRLQAQLTSAQAGLQLWSLRELTGADLQTLLQNCAGDGLELLRIDNGFAAAELTVKDCCMHALEDNAALRSMILREIQYGLRWNRLKEIQAPERNVRGALESTLTLRGFAWREIGNATLWSICIGGDKTKCVLLGGKESGGKLTAVFTTLKRAQTFAQKINPMAKPVEMKFDEIIHCSADSEGLLLDFGFIGYRLLKTDYDKVLESRSKPPVIVRLKPQDAPAQPAPAAETAPARSVDASLPNPDDFDVPARPDNSKIIPMPQRPDDPEPDPNPPRRKGILKKLFGK